MALTKIVLVGAGNIAQYGHLPMLQKLNDLCIIAGIVDVDANRARQMGVEFGVTETGTDWRAVVEKTGATALSICTHPGPNAAISTEAVRAGLHVICEKPPGRNVEDAQNMAQAAAEHPEVVTQIAFNRRFAPLYRKSLDASLKLGKPHSFEGKFTRAALGSEGPSNTMTDWITSDGSHALDLAIATMGTPEQITVWRKKVGSGVENVWTIMLENQQGVAYVHFDFAAGGRKERFEWAGADYDVTLELPERGWWMVNGQKTPDAWLAEQETGINEFFWNYGFGEQYRHFFNAINGTGPRAACDFAYGLTFMEVVAVVRQAENGTSHPFQTSVTSTAVKQAASGTVAPVLSQNGNRKPVLYIKHPSTVQKRYFNAAAIADLQTHFEVRQRADEVNLDDLRAADVVITGWGDNSELTKEQIDLATNLKSVITIGASVKALHPEYLMERGINVFNTADAIGQSVAELCLLFALAGLKRLIQTDQDLRHGAWPPKVARKNLRRTVIKAARDNAIMQQIYGIVKPPRNIVKTLKESLQSDAVTINDLQGQTVGLIGWGQIAKYFLQYLKPFNCTILVYSEADIDSELAEFGARRVGLGELLAASKVISLHRGLTDKTRGMLGETELNRIRPNSVLINTARAELIQEDALLERLKKRDIVVALDVFHKEPIPADNPIIKQPNVILTPHYSAQAPELLKRVGQQALDIAVEQVKGEGKFTPISAAQLASMT